MHIPTIRSTLSDLDHSVYSNTVSNPLIDNSPVNSNMILGMQAQAATAFSNNSNKRAFSRTLY